MWKKGLFLILGVTLLLSVGSITDAAASSWHKGTPTVLRGKYKSKKIGFGNGHAMITKMYINKKSTPFYTFSYYKNKLVSNSPMMGIASSAKYKKVSKTVYKIVGKYKTTYAKATMYLKKYSKHRIKFTFTKSFKDSDVLYRY